MDKILLYAKEVSFIHKDAYYFSHDSNAKDDPKCVLLIDQLGLEGYGIFWVLIETLRDQPNYKYPLMLIPSLARRYNTTAEKMRTVVCNYNLFMVDEEEFFSLSLMERMRHLEDKREKARLAGKKSAEKRLMLNVGSTDVQQAFNECSATVQQVKKRKVKQSKVNESTVQENSFAEFWTAYPKKKAKDDAVRAWNKINPDDDLLDTILTSIAAQKKSQEWTKEGGKYIPYPASWLNGKRWEDEVDTKSIRRGEYPVL